MDPPSVAPSAGSQAHKTYVFVDEYNRHKRLKVMRACDGCRKRKIRCDGALQNGPWPCGACVRLKLKCVPPTLDSDDERLTPEPATGSGQFTFQDSSPASSGTLGESPSQTTMTPAWATGLPRTSTLGTLGPTSAPTLRTDEDHALYSSHHYLSQQVEPRVDPNFSHDDRPISTLGSSQSQSYQWNVPTLMRTQTGASNSSGGAPDEVHATVKELSEQMGDLSIDITSVAPYITKEKQLLAETPVVEEPDVELPPSVSTDATLRIPLEMMPHEDRAMDYFGYFFTYIHPYAPVLHREKFLQQWQTDRQSISPLILEGIFACVAHYLEPPIEQRRWLALASRHEESFKDVPRLSTIQGLVLIAKAREGISKRGYYYRSWMQVKYMIAMAIDLDFHEHLELHNGEDTCKFSRSECMVRTRIWQLLFMLEGWIGGSQGRSDFSVSLETVDFSLPDPSPDVSDFEYQTCRRFVYLVQLAGIIKQTNTMWRTIRKVKKDWALDPRFVQHNEEIQTYIGKLPADMQIEYPIDDAPPLLRGKHFVAYVHIYQHLVVIMHHRPQLQALLEKKDAGFQKQLAICNDSATMICRLQEALHRDFGIHGLHFMQRGIGYNIYCILTCTMLHLATITAPDPLAKSRARMFFTRHMRMLEHCIPGATPEIRPQIDALREAFSQDTSQPFELKPELGRRASAQEPTLPHIQEMKAPLPPTQRGGSHTTSLHEAPSSRTLSNASDDYVQPFEDIPSQHALSLATSDFVSPTSAATYAPMNMQHVTSTPQSTYPLEPVISAEQQTTPPAWDPSTIFQQWTAAFGGAPPVATPPHQQQQVPTSVPAVSMQATSSSSFAPQPRVTAGQQIFYPPPRPPQTSAAIVPESTPPPVNMPPAVTPVMWQDAFTTAYVSGQGRKRYREESLGFGAYDGFHDRKG